MKQEESGRRGSRTERGGGRRGGAVEAVLVCELICLHLGTKHASPGCKEQRSFVEQALGALRAFRAGGTWLPLASCARAMYLATGVLDQLWWVHLWAWPWGTDTPSLLLCRNAETQKRWGPSMPASHSRLSWAQVQKCLCHMCIGLIVPGIKEGKNKQ
jgi:hypothetical protein